MVSRQVATANAGRTWNTRINDLRSRLAPGSSPFARESTVLLTEALGVPARSVHITRTAPYAVYPDINFSPDSGASASMINAETGRTNPLPPDPGGYAIVFGPAVLVPDGPTFVIQTLTHEQEHLRHFQRTDALFGQWQALPPQGRPEFAAWLTGEIRHGRASQVEAQIARERMQRVNFGGAVVAPPPPTSELAAVITAFVDRFPYEPVTASDGTLFHQLRLAMENWPPASRPVERSLLDVVARLHLDGAHSSRLDAFLAVNAPRFPSAATLVRAIRVHVARGPAGDRGTSTRHN